MPTPPKPIGLGAKSDQIVAGTTVIFRNLDRPGKVTKEGTGDGEAVATGVDWEEGDKISIEVYGRYNESVVVAVARGNAKHDFSTLSEDTSTIGINL